MDFKRATTYEKKEQRKCKIIEVTVELYLEEGFGAINFARIAERVDFNRTVIYNYYNNPADILLDYVGRKLDEINSVLLTNTEVDINPLYRVVGLLDLEHDFKQVASIFSSVLEPAASADHLIKFRKKLKRFSEILGMITIEDDPSFTIEEYKKYYGAFMIMFVGVTSLYAYDKRIRSVCDTVGSEYFQLGLCEAAMLVFSNTRNFELARPYWEEVKAIVDERKDKNAGK
ncbi:TetR/AcrR family transcriptional regulator [Mollicutes bacterium LVI A0039]|nr:TetR/AcrR family transcriptional regulator [Mollicutes bacterium LVI A0039]